MGEFKKFITEKVTKGLTGKSRSGGTSAIETYVGSSKYPLEKTIYPLESDGSNIIPMIINPATHQTIHIPDTLNIKILDKNTHNINPSRPKTQYLLVVTVDGQHKGFIAANHIRKPISRNIRSNDTQEQVTDNSILDVNSAEFKPDKLGIAGREYSNIEDMAMDIKKGINGYQNTRYQKFVPYLHNIVDSFTRIGVLTGGTRKEDGSYMKDIEIKSDKEQHITPQEQAVISKNFGEPLAAIYIAMTNKKARRFGFPKSINEGFYDFYTEDDKKRKQFYSVKSKGGSATTMENLHKVVLSKMTDNNTAMASYRTEIDDLLSLTSPRDKERKESATTTNIRNFFGTKFPHKQKAIISKLNSMSTGYKIDSLHQDQLHNWFTDMKKTNTEDQFVSAMNDIYNHILGDLKKDNKVISCAANEESLRKLYNTEKPPENGYIYYPMGAYIKSYLNSSPRHLDALNTVMGSAFNATQIHIDVQQNSTRITINPSHKNKYKFVYNGMSMHPSNRPIGFKSI